VAAVLLPDQRRPSLQPLAADLPTIGRFVARLARQGAVRCCSEAGPCGFELQRFLSGRQVCCDVIAPSLIPRRPGDRIRTDRRDAGQLAILYRAGALTRIHIPTDQEEAARISSDVAKTFGRSSCALGTGSRSFCSVTVVVSPRPRRGPRDMQPGSARKRGRWRRSIRRTARICARSPKPGRASAPLNRICETSLRSSRSGPALNASGVSAGLTT
jgi:hypothetical protein